MTVATKKCLWLLILALLFELRRSFALSNPLLRPRRQHIHTSTRKSSKYYQVLLHGRKENSNIREHDNDDDDDDGQVGSGPNWIERSFPVDVSGTEGSGSAEELKKIEDYNLGISGVSFQTGSLSKRKFMK